MRCIRQWSGDGSGGWYVKLLGQETLDEFKIGFLLLVKVKLG